MGQNKTEVENKISKTLGWEVETVKEESSCQAEKEENLENTITVRQQI